MNNTTPRPLSNLLQNSAYLADFQVKVSALAKINHIVHQLLPLTLQAQCRVANYRQGILIIEVTSASWLIRLRYEQENLLNALRKEYLSGLASIKYQINPSLNEEKQNTLYPQNKPDNERTISKQSADLLLDLAQHSTPRLRLSLIKLADQAKKLR